MRTTLRSALLADVQKLEERRRSSSYDVSAISVDRAVAERRSAHSWKLRLLLDRSLRTDLRNSRRFWVSEQGTVRGFNRLVEPSSCRLKRS